MSSSNTRSRGDAGAGWLAGLQLKTRWDALASRERRLVVMAAVLVGAALLWWVALGPALATLRAAKDQHARLDAQLQQMQMLQAQAGALAAQPKVAPQDARRALESSLKQTLAATGQMQVTGNRVTVTLQGASADGLAQWLLQARINARALPTEVKLLKSTAPAANDAVGLIRWNGTVVLNLPER